MYYSFVVGLYVDSKGNNIISSSTIMNADGIYLATYSALLLNLKLIRQGYYQNDTKNIPLNEVSGVQCLV